MKKRTNEDWLSSLRSEELRDSAISDLRSIIIDGLSYALSSWLEQKDPRFSPLAEEVAQETILRVLDKLDTFEGRSQFTTWVHTIAVRLALSELRHAKWKEYSLDQMLENEDPSDQPYEIPDDSTSIESSVEQDEMMRLISQSMEEVLSEKQRMALVAVSVNGIPMEVVAHRMGTNRNALYKLLHDARLKLKNHLESQGFLTDEILSAF
jgi:RNA polymerase sigma-70 factor (ECF subfamily)